MHSSPHLAYVYNLDENRARLHPFNNEDSALRYIREDLQGIETTDQSHFFYCQAVNRYAFPVELSPEGGVLMTVFLTPHALFDLQKSDGLTVDVLDKPRLLHQDVYTYHLYVKTV